MNKKIMSIIIVLIIAIVVASCFVIKNNYKEPSQSPNGGYSSYTIGNDGVFDNEVLKSDIDDMPTVVIGEDTIISNCSIVKNGNTSDLSKSDREGQNASILLNTRKSLDLINTSIETNGSGSSGLAVVIQGAEAKISNCQITTNGERSKGLLACSHGRITADNVTINTAGEKSTAVATDAGVGYIELRDCNITTTGPHSPGLLSTGEVKGENVNVSTDASTALVVDGSGKMELFDSNITSSGSKCVNMFYSASNANEEITGTFSMHNGSLASTRGPLFNVTNTNANITLNSVDIGENASGIILKAAHDTSDLGREGPVNSSRGANVNIETIYQELEGELLIDEESTLNLTLSSSHLKGNINKDKKKKKVILNIENGSSVELTDNCYVDELKISPDSTLIENGFKIITK